MNSPPFPIVDSERMKRTLIVYAFLTALLVVAVRYFELSFFAGEVSTKIFITVIGGLFLALGILTGVRLRRRQVEREVVVEYVDREVPRVETVVQYVERPAEPEAEVLQNDLLSPRESEVLAHIARGLTNRQIADALFVSENTIKTHINNIYSKLGVSRRTQALSKAKEMKILR